MRWRAVGQRFHGPGPSPAGPLRSPTRPAPLQVPSRSSVAPARVSARVTRTAPRAALAPSLLRSSLTLPGLVIPETHRPSRLPGSLRHASGQNGISVIAWHMDRSTTSDIRDACWSITLAAARGRFLLTSSRRSAGCLNCDAPSMMVPSRGDDTRDPLRSWAAKWQHAPSRIAPN